MHIGAAVGKERRKAQVERSDRGEITVNCPTQMLGSGPVPRFIPGFAVRAQRTAAPLLSDAHGFSAREARRAQALGCSCNAWEERIRAEVQTRKIQGLGRLAKHDHLSRI